MSMTLNFLGGAPFELLYDGVKLAISNTRKFNTHLRSLKFTLDCLQPQIIEQIRLQNLQLNIPVQEIQELQRKIDEGIVLVGKLSRLNSCNIRIWGSCCSCLMVSYADQLDDLNESLRRLLEILRLQSLAQVNQIGILARITRDRQDELGRRQLEILSNQRRIIGTLMQQQQIIKRIEENSVAASTGKGAAPVQVCRLGAVFQALFDAVVQVKVKNSLFKRHLEDFKFTLDCLKPLVQEIVECNKVLHFPKEEILEDFIEYLEKGVDVVYKCSKSSLWNRFKKYECINSVFELDESLQRLFNILRLQIENDVKEALVSVSKLENEIEEIERSCVLQQDQFESAPAEPQLPKVEAEVMNMQVTRDVESMDSTGNVEVGDESHMRTEGSSLASHQIDVAVEEEEREPLSPTIGRIEERFDLAPAGSNMEVGDERIVGQGEEDTEIRLVVCKEAEKEATTPTVPVSAAHKRHASVETVVKNYEEHLAARRIQVAFRRYLGRNSFHNDEEIEGSCVLQHHQFESAPAEPQLPKVEAEVMNMQVTRDVESMDSTGNVKVGDESHMRTEGSSLASHQIDVAVEEEREPLSPTIGRIEERFDSAPAGSNMEVGDERTVGQGEEDREIWLVACKEAEKEATTSTVPVLAAHNRHVSVETELEKEVEEIERSRVLQHHQFESAAAPQLPTVESDVMNMQLTRVAKESIDSTGNVEVGNESHMRTKEVGTVRNPCSFKVHRSMCIELWKLVDRISEIFPDIEASRPRCSTGIQALCMLNGAIEKAKQLLQYCHESSKLYLAFTGDVIVSRCQQSRNLLEQSLCQIQNWVPVVLVAEISKIVDDLKAATFRLDPSEDEAGKVIRELIHQGASALDSIEDFELKVLQLASVRLHIATSKEVLIEKRSIKKLLQKVGDSDRRKKQILTYFLYLFRKYGNLILVNKQRMPLCGSEVHFLLRILPKTWDIISVLNLLRNFYVEYLPD